MPWLCKVFCELFVPMVFMGNVGAICHEMRQLRSHTERGFRKSGSVIKRRWWSDTTCCRFHEAAALITMLDDACSVGPSETTRSADSVATGSGFLGSPPPQPTTATDTRRRLTHGSVMRMSINLFINSLSLYRLKFARWNSASRTALASDSTRSINSNR